MNISRESLKYKVKDYLYKVQYKGNRGRDRAAREIVDLVMEEVDKAMGKYGDWDKLLGFPAHLEPIVQRLEKGLSLNLMKRTAEAQAVYEWIIEQEKNGQRLEVWIAWAMSPERVQYVGKYRGNPSNIMADWPQAFDSRVKGYNPQNLEVGF